MTLHFNRMYKCEKQGCNSKENFIPCLYCANSFYCSVACRESDDIHESICKKTNTREMLYLNTMLAIKLISVLSQYAKKHGPGIINVRSYNSIWDLRSDEFILKDIKLFISFTLLENWHGNVPTVYDTLFEKQMIVNFHFEGMNKPQLHRLQMTDKLIQTPNNLKIFLK